MSERHLLPIIVGGCHRSGTSLVRRLLDGHPRIDCPAEVMFFRDFFGDYREDPLAHLRFSRTVRALVDPAVALRVLGAAFVSLHEAGARSRGKERWADKNPDNAVHLPHWQELLGGQWLYLHVVRHPLDTLASMAEAGFPLTLPARLPERIAHYLRFTAAGLAWVRAHPGRARLVVYDALAADPAATLTELMEWLGERSVPEQLQLGGRPARPGLEDPKIAATRMVHARSIGRWKRTLTEEEARVAWEATAPLWREIDGAEVQRSRS